MSFSTQGMRSGVLLSAAFARLRFPFVVPAWIFFLLAAPAVHGQTYIFGRADLAVDFYPASVATGDFNGDGIIDLVSVNQIENTVLIWLGTTNGGFSAPVTYPTGPVPVFAGVGDFNGDGNMDLAVADWNCVPSPPDGIGLTCGAGTVSILLGNGDGSFQPNVDYATGTAPTSIGVADFNGDGKLDFAVVNQNDSSVSVLLGNGDGTFQPRVTYTIAAQLSPIDFYANSGSLVVGDFNGDHKPDLAIACNQTVSVLLGNGDGTFQNHIDSGSGGAALTAADFNGDGNLDLAVNGDGNSTTSVLLGKGDGTFALGATYAGGSEVAAADLNGDGKPDLAISADGAAGTSVSVLIGNGDGTFQTGVQYAPSAALAVIADLNGDRKLDLVVANGLFVSVLLGFGDGTFVGATNYPFQPSTSFPDMVSADFNGDGKADLAAQSDFGVGIYLGNGDGTFQPEVPTGLLHAVGQIAAADFNGDGKADLVTTFANQGQVVVLIGNGDGTFQPPVEYAVLTQPGSATVGDFNGDGKPDVAVADFPSNTSDSVSILINNGDGTFKPHVDYTVPLSAYSMAVGDFKGSGILDIAVADGALLLGNGDGTFAVGMLPDSIYYQDFVVAADFNGDGKLDLALEGGNLYVLFGHGDGTFEAPILNSGQGGGFGLTVADFNGDGKPDLINGGSYYPGAAEILLNNGDGTFQPVFPSFLSSGPVAVGDFNQDGAPDVAAGSNPSGAITVMLGAAFKTIAPGALNFGSQGVATTSLPLTTIISNPSNVSFNIASIVASGNFSQSNDCGATLAPAAHCTVTANFTPTATGSQSGAITITDSTRISPLGIPVSGTGVNGPFLMGFPARADFAQQGLGTSSKPLAITLANTGNAGLNISGISITGVDSSDFAQTNNCGSSLPAAGSCVVNVVFNPEADGSRTATLSIANTAPGSPQLVSLTGAGVDFTIGPVTGFTTSAAVLLGQSAVFDLSVASQGGWSGTVNLSCAITPVVKPAPRCSLPSSVQLTGGNGQHALVTIGTTAPVYASAGYSGRFTSGLMSIAWTGIVALFASLLLIIRKQSPLVAAPVIALAVASCLSCGGGSGSPPSAGTPSGTYTAVITGTSGSLSHRTTLTVIVYVQ